MGPLLSDPGYKWVIAPHKPQQKWKWQKFCTKLSCPLNHLWNDRIATTAASILPSQCFFVVTRMGHGAEGQRSSALQAGGQTHRGEFGSLTENEWKTGSNLRAHSSESGGQSGSNPEQSGCCNKLTLGVRFYSTSNITKKTIVLTHLH